MLVRFQQEQREDDRHDLVIRSHPSTCSYRCRHGCCVSILLIATLAWVAEESPVTGEANDGKTLPSRIVISWEPGRRCYLSGTWWIKHKLSNIGNERREAIFTKTHSRSGQNMQERCTNSQVHICSVNMHSNPSRCLQWNTAPKM